MNWDTMRDHCERIAKTTKEQWDASPYQAPPAVGSRAGLLAIKPKAHYKVPHREQPHA